MNRRWLLGVLAAGFVARTRCGGDDRPIDVDAVNALVPAGLDLVFEQRTLIDSNTTYTLAAPRGWKAGIKGFAMLVHPDRARYRDTELLVHETCDGICQPKDWNAAIDSRYAYYLRGTVLKDVRGDTSRTLIARAPNGQWTITLVARWKPGADHYDACSSTLDGDLQAAAFAFDKACEVVRAR